MKKHQRKAIVISIMILFMVFSYLSIVSAEEYEAMKGVASTKVFFDMRDGVPQTAAIHLKLIHDTYKELMVMKKKPAFVVGFMGSAVKLVSSSRGDFTPEDVNYLKEIAGTLTKMSGDGIQLEICMFAAKLFGINPTSIQSEIKQVGNGWISEIGYQTRGYSLVPVY